MLKVASVGLGWWSSELAKAVHGNTEKLQIAACFSGSAEKRQAFATRFGAKPYDSYEKVLSDRGIDAVLLTTPHSQHAAHVAAAAHAGKHVFVEKPFTLTAASAREAAAVCMTRGVVLAVGHNRRFAPAAREMKRLVEAGTFGTILHAEANFSAPSALGYTAASWRANRVESPAGGLAGLGIHMIDGLIALLGPVARLACQAKRRAVTVDIDDTTSVLLEFKAGYTGYLGTQCAAPYSNFLRIYGTGASAETRADFAELSVQPAGGLPQPVSLPRVDTLLTELEAFAAACVDGKPYPVSVDEAIHGVAVMEAMALSATNSSAWRTV